MIKICNVFLNGILHSSYIVSVASIDDILLKLTTECLFGCWYRCLICSLGNPRVSPFRCTKTEIGGTTLRRVGRAAFKTIARACLDIYKNYRL
ncbi:unnamed protein product [Citrullus colocynthis]|uniref:Uncharacterized protein n=1 Tax=Citrullus colocynthis TaxID=252529 RepID=A0ABP0YNT8_9ROSI